MPNRGRSVKQRHHARDLIWGGDYTTVVRQKPERCSIGGDVAVAPVRDPAWYQDRVARQSLQITARDKQVPGRRAGILSIGQGFKQLTYSPPGEARYGPMLSNHHRVTAENRASLGPVAPTVGASANAA